MKFIKYSVNFFVLFEYTEKAKTYKELHGPFDDEDDAFNFAKSLPEKENGMFWVVEPYEVNNIDMAEVIKIKGRK